LDNLLQILFFLGLSLLFIAVIGHGLWLAAAWVVRQIVGLGSELPAGAVRVCPRCGVVIAKHSATCASCGWPRQPIAPPVSPPLGPLADLQATARVLERFHEKGGVTLATYDRVMTAIEAEQRRLAASEHLTPAQPAIPRTAPPVTLPPIALAPPQGNIESAGRHESPFAAFAESIPTTPCPAAGAVTPTESISPDTAVELTFELADAPSNHAAVHVAPQRPPATPAPRPRERVTPTGTPLPPQPQSPPRPAPPRKSLNELLAAFMEEKNIRWGELVGGLLIVGCSIALVFSLWAKIEQIAILKFFLFTGVTSAIFGVGLYTEHRWKLPTTSRGVLIIATLLVPLNFLAIAGFAVGMSPTDVQVIGGELVALASFTWLTQRAGRVLVPGWSWMLTAGVMGSSLAQIMIRRFAGAGDDLLLLVALGSLPLVSYLGTSGWMLRRTRGWTDVNETQANSVFILLGSVTFATMLALGLLLYNSDDPRDTLSALAPLVSLGGVPALASGLVLWRRLAQVKLGSLSTAAAATAVLGAAVLVSGIALAWPHPSGILPVALVDFVAITAIGFRFRLPPAHLLAAPCLALAYLLAGHLLLPPSHEHHISWNSSSSQMIRSLVSGSSGMMLVLLVGMFVAVVEFLRRIRQDVESQLYRVITAATAAVSLALVIVFGFARSGDPYWAAPALAIYAAAAFALAWRMQHGAATWAGSGLALAAIVQSIVFEFADRPDVFHAQLALLVHASAAMLAASLIRWLGSSGRTSERVTGATPATQARTALTLRVGVADSLGGSAIASSSLAVPFWIYAMPSETFTDLSLCTLWIAVIWTSLSLLHRRAGLFSAAQIMVALGVVFAVTAVLETRDWYATTAFPLLDPRALQSHGVALAIIGLAWAGLRMLLRQTSTARLGSSTPETSDPDSAMAERSSARRNVWHNTISWLLNPPWPPIDRMVTALVLIGFIAMTVFAIVPGTLAEFAPRGGAGAAISRFANFSHDHAFGLGSWLLLGLLVANFAARLRERFEPHLILTLILVAAMACPLLAGLWESDVATASALRFLSAAFLLAASIPIWLRSRLVAWSTAFGWPGASERSAGLANEARTLILVLALVPVLGLTLYPAAATLAGHPVAGVAAGSLFARVGDSFSYALPLSIIVLTLVGHGVRERSSGFAVAAGLVLNLTVSLGYLLAVATAGPLIGSGVWVRLVQLNAIATAGFALVWLASRDWLARIVVHEEPRPIPQLLNLQAGLALAMNLAVIAPADVWLFLFPNRPTIGVMEVGGVFGWLAIVLAGAAVAWIARSRGGEVTVGLMYAVLLVVSSLAACALCRWDAGLGGVGVPWLGFHTLLVAHGVAVWLTLLIGPVVERSRRAAGESPAGHGSRVDWRLTVVQWTNMAAIVEVIFTARAALDWSEPGRPWWTVGAFAGTSAIMAALAMWTLERGYLYWSAIFVNAAATNWWLGSPWSASAEWLMDLTAINIIALAAPAAVWMMIELRWLRPKIQAKFAGEARRDLVPVHWIVAVASITCVAMLVAAGLVADAFVSPLAPNGPVEWLAIAAAAAAAVICLWDPATKLAMPALYAAGLVVAGMTLDQFDLAPRWLGWTGAIFLAAYSVATSYLWSRRSGLRRLADSLHAPRRDDSPLGGPSWLLSANLVLATAVVVLAFVIVLTFAEYSPRILAAKAAIAQALAVGFLARGARRSNLQRVSLWLVVIGAVAWGWSWLDPMASGNLLNRGVIVMTVLAALTALYGVGLGKFFPRETEWTHAARKLVPPLLLLGAMSLAFILTTEAALWRSHHDVPMNPLAIAAVAAAVIALCSSSLVCAIVPGRDPLGLTDRGRELYVYAAEGLLALLFMHVRFTMPWLFHGFFEQYWPLIVMALAFSGAGLSELFRRQGRLVLAGPLERTGAFLPLLPVISLWILPSNVPYSIQLVTIGILYGALSITRKSFGFGLLAAIASNGGLWYYLNKLEGFGLADHPQLWLIPAALSVLAAAYLNRDQLTEQQLVRIRYITTMTIYISSTADIFMNGVQEAPWLPMALAGLSVAGVFAGIMLRVQSFLFLGLSFLVLSLVTIIHSASVNLHSAWPWSVAGITLGVAIIAVFGMFEKKRNELLQVVEGLKQWER